MSVCLLWTTRLPPNRFPWNLTVEYFLKICEVNSSFVNIWPEWQAVYAKTNIHFLSFLVQFLKWDVSDKSFGKIKTNILSPITFSKNCALYDIMWKNTVELCRAQMTVWHMHIAKWTVRGSNTGGGEIFRTCPDRPWGPPSLLYDGYRVFPGGIKRPGCDANPSPPSNAEVWNRVELYLYSP
jgi:hypothetical protein